MAFIISILKSQFKYGIAVAIFFIAYPCNRAVREIIECRPDRNAVGIRFALFFIPLSASYHFNTSMASSAVTTPFTLLPSGLIAFSIA